LVYLQAASISFNALI